MISLSDMESNELHSIDLGFIPKEPTGIYLQDFNMDDFLDISAFTGGTVNETYALYIWRPTTQTFAKVIYKGFDMLCWFTVYDGYIENFIRGDYPDNNVT